MRRVFVYATVWLLATLAALALRVAVFAHEDRFVLAISYMFGTWLPVMALSVWEARVVRSRLGPSLQRKPSWAIPFVLPDDPHGTDPELARLHREYRAFRVFTLVVFCSYLVVVPALMF